MDAALFYSVTFYAAIALPFAVCVLLAPLEQAFPRRAGQRPLAPRWRVNMALAAGATALAVAAGVWATPWLGAAGARAGLFSLAALDIPGPVKFIAGLLLIDLAMFALHVLSHRIAPLWRLHRVHHSDDEFDASTGLRHHALEALVNICVLTFFYGLIGMPFAVIAVYGVLVAVHSVLSHANIAIAPRVDRVLRLFIVTPDMHRLHHSADAREYDSNYSQIFPWWDWLFRTFRAKSVELQTKMQLGLDKDENMAKASALRLTLSPFKNISSNALPETRRPPGSNPAVAASARRNRSAGAKRKRREP